MEKNDNSRVQEAVQLARAVAVNAERVVLLHCPDAQTQLVVMPEQPDHGLQARLDTAIAAELAAGGVEVAVQIVDRDAYLAWLAGRPSTKPWRTGYRDPSRLVRGGAALEMLGVAPSAARPRPELPAPRQRKGTPAERLVRAWLDEDDPEFDRMLDALLDEGRQGVLDIAIRRVEADYADEEADDFILTLQEVAEAAEIRPGAWAALFVVAALLEPEAAKLPDPAPIEASLRASGHFPAGHEIVIADGWFDPETIAGMTACALRKTLRNLVAGTMPPGPAPLARPPEHGIVAMLGVAVHDDPMAWEDAVAMLAETGEGEPPAQEPDPVAEMRGDAYETWRDAVLASNADFIDILFPTTPSRLADDLEEVMDEPQDDESGPAAPTPWPEELRDFVEIAAREAGDEALVCVPRVAGGRVELSLFTASGRLLDTRDFGAPELGMVPSGLRAALAEIVRVEDRPPEG